MAFASALIGMVVVAVAAVILTVVAMAVWQRGRVRRCRCVTGILDSSTDGVFAVDRNWRLTYMNDRARVLLNASAQATGKSLWEAVPGAVTAAFNRPCRHAMEQQEAVEVDAFYPPLEAWFSLCVYPIPDGLAVSFRDITAARRRQDEQRRKAVPAAPAPAAPQGEPVPRVEDVPLAGLMDLAAAAHRPSVEGRGMAWQPASGVDGTVMVRSDRVLLLRMIGGLIDTAVRQGAGGTVGLECRISPRAVQIVVRSSAAPAQAPGDAGLGAVRALSRRLNHPVEILPVAGRGMEWTITVPRGREAPRPAAPVRAAAAAVAGLAQAPAMKDVHPQPQTQAQSHARDSRRCILLVDDDPIVLMGLEAVLSDWDYDIVTAASADQAMERLATRGRRPDVVMADYQLRNNRVGTEVVSRVRERFGPVPGVILTGETGGSCQVEADAMGLTVMLKPVTPQQLAAALGRTTAP